MRINYYRFPENTPESILLENGCAVVLKSGREIHVDSIPEERRPLVDYVDRTASGISVSTAKKLLREHGGTGWTCHIERDGTVFGTTPITLKGNNSRFQYNHHL